MFLSDAVRNGKNDALETTIGVSPIVRVYNGTPPADESTALAGNTLLAQGTLPSDWLAASAAGVKSLLGSWTVTGSATGSGTFVRVFDSTGTTCHMQLTLGASVPLSTNALTAANGNVLNFASTTGVAVGKNVSGTGIPEGSTVVAFTGTTVTISQTSTAGVANAAAVTFGYETVINNNSIVNGQAVNITSFTYTAAH
jgi:hypothetical protein